MAKHDQVKAKPKNSHEFVPFLKDVLKKHAELQKRAFQNGSVCFQNVKTLQSSSLLVRLLLLFMWKQRLHCHTPHKSLDLFPPCHASLFPSGTTWTARGTTCWAWRGWRRTCWPRSRTSSSPTWRAEASNRVPSRRWTPPSVSPRTTPSELPDTLTSTHTHTQIHTQIHVHTQRWPQGLERFFGGGPPSEAVEANVDPEDETLLCFLGSSSRCGRSSLPPAACKDELRRGGVEGDKVLVVCRRTCQSADVNG